MAIPCTNMEQMVCPHCGFWFQNSVAYFALKRNTVIVHSCEDCEGSFIATLKDGLFSTESTIPESILQKYGIGSTESDK